MIYGDFSIAFHLGRCYGYAPRPSNFEEYFAQPDL